MLKKLTLRKGKFRLELGERAAFDACSNACIAGCSEYDPRAVSTVEIRLDI